MKRDSLVVAEGCVLSGDEVGRTRPNANALIVGTTGCGKSTSVILPTVARMHCSNPILSYAKSGTPTLWQSTSSAKTTRCTS